MAPLLSSGRPGGSMSTRAQITSIVVYTCAAALGLAAAYLYLSAAPLTSTRGAAEAEHASRADFRVVKPQQRTAAVTLQSNSSKAAAAAAAAEAGGTARKRATVAEDAEERRWFSKLSSEACAETETHRVCSHRAKADLEGVASGSLSAYASLWKANIRCFDIDLVVTSDGEVLASHPDDLQAALGAAAASWGSLREGIGAHTLAEVRAAGGDEERVPTIQLVLQLLGDLIKEDDEAWAKLPDDYSLLPLLLLELKGAAFSAKALAAIAASAAAEKVTRHVALFVASDAQLGAALDAGFKGPLVRAFMDAEDPSPALSAEALEPFTLLGPSLRMSDSFWAEAIKLGKTTMAWTADQPSDLHRALESKADAVISNKPIAVRQTLLEWRDRCSDEF